MRFFTTMLLLAECVSRAALADDNATTAMSSKMCTVTATIKTTLTMTNFSWHAPNLPVTELTSANNGSRDRTNITNNDYRTNIAEICAPRQWNTTPDLSFPCNGYLLYVEGCSYTFHNPVDQRHCACASLFFASWQGCAACFSAHGNFLADSGKISSFSSSYCTAAATPTKDLKQYILDEFGSRGLGPTLIGKPDPGRDPLHGSTEVSLYWTSSVTGSAPWEVTSSTTPEKTTALSKLRPGAPLASTTAPRSRNKTSTENDALPKSTTSNASDRSRLGDVMAKIRYLAIAAWLEFEVAALL